MKIELTKDQLQDMYLQQKLSRNQIAKKISISSNSVLRYMKKYEIPRRTKSEALSGLPKSFSHRQKLSESKKGEKNFNYGKKCSSKKRSWYKCPNGEFVSMRSSWEVSFANYLDSMNINWEYEPKTFVLENGSGYTPDFYLVDTKEWVEVKGWLTEEYKKRIDLWKKSYPKEIYILADRQYLTSKGINLKQIWVTSKPKFECKQCNCNFYKKYPSQKLCSVLCRNKFIANNPPELKIEKIKRKYNGNQSGQNNNFTKLNLKDVEEIRLMKISGIQVKKIAEKMKISKTTVYNICNRRSWS